MTITDDFSRFTTLYLLGNKSEAFGKFKKLVEMTNTAFGRVPKKVRFDGGGECRV